jgi:hypothetical protein
MAARARSLAGVREAAWHPDPDPDPGPQELNQGMAGPITRPSSIDAVVLKRQNNRDTKQQTGERPP